MIVFVDTSALYALIDSSDSHHARAATALRLLRGEHSQLLTHNYVIVETAAIVQRRLPSAAVRSLIYELVPALDVEWVTAEMHASAASSLTASGRKRPSLVDWVSFHLMRRMNVTTAFAFDRDFESQGFELIA